MMGSGSEATEGLVEEPKRRVDIRAAPVCDDLIDF